MADVGGGDIIDLGGEEPTEDALPVINEDADDGALPPGAALQPDGSVLLTLRYPVTLNYRSGQSGQVREEHYETLRLRRLNGAAMRAIMSAGSGKTVVVGLAKSTGIVQGLFDKLFDRLDASDASAAAQVLNHFLSPGEPAAPGQPSSP